MRKAKLCAWPLTVTVKSRLTLESGAMKRVSVEDFCPRIPRLKSRVLRDEE
jgi:hypothetical protein